ncbi:MAG: hypothetical protein ACK462_04180, partial [Planctomyces sp.]
MVGHGLEAEVKFLCKRGARAHRRHIADRRIPERFVGFQQPARVGDDLLGDAAIRDVPPMRSSAALAEELYLRLQSMPD